MSKSFSGRRGSLLNTPERTSASIGKDWVDLKLKAERGKIAKDLMALANHGGGFLVFGIKEDSSGQLVHAGASSFNLKPYSQDSFNDIVKTYASPAFECRVIHVQCPGKCDGSHVVVKVPGEHRVPIRCCRGGPNNGEPHKSAIYIRRPKPESAPIEEPHEWDDLFKRCLSAQRDNLIEQVRMVISQLGPDGLAESLKPGSQEKLTLFEENAAKRFRALQDQHGRVDLYKHGVWSTAYCVSPTPQALPTLDELLETMRGIAGSETGWPPWWVPTRDGIRPYPYGDLIECWLAEDPPVEPTEDNFLRHAMGPQDGAHSDFWQASPSGCLYLVRGYQEDGRDGQKREPGQFLDFTTVPIWRLAECLLHAHRFALDFAGPSATVAVSVRWEGLENRKLVSMNRGRDFRPRLCRQPIVTSRAEFAAATLQATLAEAVQKLAEPLYAAFDFFAPGLGLYEEEISRMLNH